MKNIRQLHRAAFPAGLLILVFAIAGCASAPPPPIPKTAISAKLPVVAALPETKEAQEKGGVEIAVVPVLYKTAKKEKYSVRQVSAGLGTSVAASLVHGEKKAQSLIYVHETLSPFLDVDPGRLAFTVRVNNKLSRVFRGQGSVVQFNVGGKLIPFDRVDYKQFLNGIVPPRNESEFVIYGPALDLLPDKGTVGIFLYDVVTATDTAGNVTEKQNYEWYFDYTVKLVQDEGVVREGDTFMEPAGYQMALAKARKRSVDEPDTELSLAR